MRNKLLILVLISVFAVFLVGCKSDLMGGNALENLAETQPTSSIDSDSDQTTMVEGKLPVVIYFADPDSAKLKKEIRYIAKAEASKSLNNLAKIIVNQVLDGPDPKSGLKRVIDQNVKLIGDVEIDISGATATVNLSKEFSDAVEGGEKIESLAINSIVNSLTELKEIQKVKIQVEGKEGVMKGGTKLSTPFERDTSMIHVETLAEDETTATDNESQPVETSKPKGKKASENKEPKESPDANTSSIIYDADGENPSSSITDVGE